MHPNFTLHEYVGFAFSAVLALRLIYGLLGPRAQRFGAWVPYTRERFAAVKQDVRSLLRFKMSEPKEHRGLNAAVQSLGPCSSPGSSVLCVIMSIYIVPRTRRVGCIP